MSYSCWWLRGNRLVWYDDVIEWKHFPRYWPFVRGIHRSHVNSPHKGQGRAAFVFSLTCAWIKAWLNNGDAGYLKRHRAHNDVTVISTSSWNDASCRVSQHDRFRDCLLTSREVRHVIIVIESGSPLYEVVGIIHYGTSVWFYFD